ncbi:MAG TPA: glycosyltransferase family A protein [Chloroflexia bacterium]|nr:glycosyltransferase family A protein [Chloroflexia bacterium]
MPDLSVIVPTHNRQAFLPALLASLAAQDYPADAWELIVVDDGSTDGTRAYLLSDPRPGPPHTTCIFQGQQGPASARNTGARAATGRALLFLDDDMIAASELVRAHAIAQCDRDRAVVIGHLTVPATGRSPWMAWEDAQVAQHYAALDSGRRVPGPRDFFSGNCSVDAALFRRVGGYNTALKRAEDLELGYRLAAAGAAFCYGPAADSLHLGLHTFASWVRNARLYGHADVSLAWEQGHAELRAEIFRWFYLRKWPTRSLVRLCGAARWCESPLIGGLHLGGGLAHRLGLHGPAQAAYSGIYNLAYWLALSDVLGPDRFWASISAARPTGRRSGALAPAPGEHGPGAGA